MSRGRRPRGLAALEATFRRTMSDLRLCFRADDLGMCRSVNLGARAAAAAGLLRNVSVMATGPALDHVPEAIAGLGLCVGMHVALNCEWTSPRWGGAARGADPHPGAG